MKPTLRLARKRWVEWMADDGTEATSYTLAWQGEKMVLTATGSRFDMQVISFDPDDFNEAVAILEQQE